jgi:DNA-binding NarL/FixJ family response regulator
MIKLIIADDHKLVRDGLKVMLEDSAELIQIVREAASGKELIAKLTDGEADVILMDMHMPEIDGLEAIRYITNHFPNIKILVLSITEQEKYVAEAIQTGAAGYILKSTDQEELVHAIQAVARGEQYISTQIAIKLLKNLTEQHTNAYADSVNQQTSGELSKRELEVLQLVAQGYTNTQISEILFTSKRTVETHRQSLLDKTGSKNTASLIVYASRHRLLNESKSSD